MASKILFAFFLTLFFGLSWSQKNELPLLPDHYTTKIQANVVLSERSGAKSGAEPAGLSYAFDEAIGGISMIHWEFSSVSCLGV